MDDEYFMRRALKLASLGTPSPNPYVGAILVKDGEIIGRGYHEKAGMPHAEIEALKSCENPAGATLYVTLEPCSHHGRTPPCTDAIIKAKIKKVVYALDDPNPQVNGKQILEDAGIKVVSGVLQKEAEKLNEVFVKNMTTKLPFVVLKTAMSSDGKIATKNRAPLQITGEKSRKIVHELRGKYDAILVGVNTILADDPQLTCRTAGGRDPLRVILDSRLKTPFDAKVLKDKNVLIATTEKYDSEKMRLLSRKAKVAVFGKDHVNLKQLLKFLYAEGVCSILVEGGGKVNQNFIKAGLIDKMVTLISSKKIGVDGLDAFGGKTLEEVRKELSFMLEETLEVDGDKVIISTPKC
ncbi:MAG TPA: bifunctional diaminohydroxyphosphoribosylaminopyrimidine deaminase/5-amino-6-(5-phosphoribosylamino)uracil reductase RibD [Candidatus Altiarchaeales archaeon]|nr:bifunctional diaminohydroxyphosphoribosylaminopyrimidine deaminase/5-amino-6-(5-phosphoribosylamino)uracil reductase RibD [Candidatus Altiarchaeales archaeon]